MIEKFFKQHTHKSRKIPLCNSLIKKLNLTKTETPRILTSI